MHTPKFWQKNNLISYLLLPFSFIYLCAAYLRNCFFSPKKIDKFVISIGNLTAGGAGKTPIAIELGKILKTQTIGFSYLSRGYGGKISDFTLVDKKIHTAAQIGDEPLLLAEIENSFIAKNRANALAKISALNPEKPVIITDDGLQNPSFKKDFSILVIDGIYGFGNGLIIPAGPLREPIPNGIKKADLVIIIGEDKFNIARFCVEKKIIFAKIIAVNINEFANSKLVAFCGIARPEKFFASLKEINNFNLIKKFSYPDHYLYKDNELEKMLNFAINENALLITTKKDWVRLKPKYQQQIKYLDIKIEFEKTDEFKEIINKVVKL